MKNKLATKMLNHWNRVQREVVGLFPKFWCLQITIVFYAAKHALVRYILGLDAEEVRLDKVIIPLTLNSTNTYLRRERPDCGSRLPWDTRNFGSIVGFGSVTDFQNNHKQVVWFIRASVHHL